MPRIGSFITMAAVSLRAMLMHVAAWHFGLDCTLNTAACSGARRIVDIFVAASYSKYFSLDCDSSHTVAIIYYSLVVLYYSLLCDEIYDIYATSNVL